MNKTHTRHSTAGYTFIEMLVVIAIIGIIVPTLTGSIVSLYSGHATTLSRAMALSLATDGIREIVKDVRSASYAENGALPVVSIATSSLILYADTDFDGKVERVRYFLDTTTMKKGVVEPTATSSYPLGTEVVEVLAPNIVNNRTATPIFRYYTSTSTEIVGFTTGTLHVRRVEVELVSESRFGRETSQVTIRSGASIRNLKDAY